MRSGLKPFSLLVKPAGADCNLRCRYCFYLDRYDLHPASSRPRMTETVLERMICSFMAVPQPVYSFGWQGGEPTLMGLDFFRLVTDLQKRYGLPGAQVANGLQTNATLIDDAFASHLAAYGFLVGVSLDGPPELHDPNRRTVADRGTHADVLRGIQVLRSNHVEFNVLTLVNRLNGQAPERVYDYLVEQGVKFHQYIECVEFDKDGELLPFSLDGDAWGEFLCRLFDRWYPDDVYTVSVRLFDSIIWRLVEGQANCCTFDRDCRQYFVVEHNGDIYPCDFYVYPELCLGNVMDADWKAIQGSKAYTAFGSRKGNRHRDCVLCDFAWVCAGDCPKNRMGHVAGRDSTSLSVLCSGWRRFFAHALPRLRQLAAAYKKRHLAKTPGVR